MSIMVMDHVHDFPMLCVFSTLVFLFFKKKLLQWIFLFLLTAAVQNIFPTYGTIN